MNEDKPQPTIEALLTQVNTLMQMIQNHKGPINMTPELAADIENFEKLIKNFKEDADELFDLFDLDIKQLEQEALDSPQVRSSDKQLIKQAKDIEIEARVMKLALTKGKDKERQGSTRAKGNSKQQMKERRKLFKSIGGDQKWIPL